MQLEEGGARLDWIENRMQRFGKYKIVARKILSKHEIDRSRSFDSFDQFLLYFFLLFSAAALLPRHPEFRGKAQRKLVPSKKTRNLSESIELEIVPAR